MKIFNGIGRFHVPHIAVGTYTECRPWLEHTYFSCVGYVAEIRSQSRIVIDCFHGNKRSSVANYMNHAYIRDVIDYFFCNLEISGTMQDCVVTSSTYPISIEFARCAYLCSGN